MKSLDDAGKCLTSSGRCSAGTPASSALSHVIVTRKGNLFVLRVVKDGQIIETVKAMDAQMILDYCYRTLPDGTKIEWVIC